MRSTLFNAGELLADQPAFANQGMVAADGVYPAAGGYRPIRAFEAIPLGTLPGRCLGAASFRANDGSSIMVAGTADKLFRYGFDGWREAGSGFATSPFVGWDFEIFGDLIVAVNGAQRPQKLDLAADAATFVPLGGDPPRMNTITTVGQFLVGGVIDGDTSKVRWSRINDAEGWELGIGQADEQSFAVGGAVTGVLGGEYGLVFQESRISRMDYAGDDAIFDFEEVSSELGCVAPRSIAQFGAVAYFLSPQGFMAFDGRTLRPIGDQRVDRTFLTGAARAYYAFMSASIDPINKLVIWTKPDVETTQRWFLYHWGLDRWSTATVPSQLVFRGYSRDTSVDEIDTPVDDPSLAGVGVDDPRWLGGEPSLYVVDDTNALGRMAGANMAATLAWGDMELAAGRRTRLTRSRVLTDAEAPAVRIAGRDRLSLPALETTHSTAGRSGDIPLRRNNRYVAPSVKLSEGAGWTYIKGLELMFEPGGV